MLHEFYQSTLDQRVTNIEREHIRVSNLHDHTTLNDVST